ncbi:MAG: hypothetical protein WC070_00175 [Candidatus Magasanikbacteria bacterium]
MNQETKEKIETFKIAFLNPASEKTKLGFFIFSILITTLYYILQFSNPEQKNQSINQWINKNIESTEIMNLLFIILFFVSINIIYIIYEQKKHSLYLKLNNNEIIILHKFKNKIIEQNKINKDNIINTNFYIKNIGNNKNPNRIIVLEIQTKKTEKQEFRIPIKISQNLLEKMKKYNYPISEESQKIIKQEKSDDNLDKFILKASIIGFSILFIFGISLTILLVYLEQK